MKQSYLIAAAILAVAALWLASGQLGDDSSGELPPQKSAASEEPARSVEVTPYHASPMLREVIVQGQTEARHQVTLKAEVAATVEELSHDQGDAVGRGDLLLRLSAEERPQRLAQARALVKQRELEYQAAVSLNQKGLQAERQLAEAMTLLQDARVALKSAQLQSERLRVKAPFDGLIQARHVDPGDYLQAGDPVMTVVMLDPLVLRADVSESEVGALASGMGAAITLSDGSELAGKLVFVAPVADSSTRTFPLEVEAANPGSSHRGGMSATIRLPLAPVKAHKVSPALLSLNDEGVLGLKSVDKDGVVRFHPVQILKSERDGLWLGGLPEEVNLITVGQGFVRDGDKVNAVSKQ